MEAETSVTGDGGCETAPRRRSKSELQDHVLSETAFLKNATQDEILDNFRLANYMSRTYGIVASDPHTYLKADLVHLTNQLNEAFEKNRSEYNRIEKERDERVAMETKDRKEYLDKSTKIDKEIDEKLKKIQELVSTCDEDAKLRELEHERFKPLAEKSAKLAAILDGVDTERVRLFQMGYETLDVKRRKHIYIMLDAIGQSEEDSEKDLLKVRQGKPVAPMHGSLQEYSDVWCSIKKINPDAVEPFDPKDAIIDEANRKIKYLQAKVEDFEAKERRRMSKQASRRRSKPTKRLVQGGEVEDTQPKKQRHKALEEAGAQ